VRSISGRCASIALLVASPLFAQGWRGRLCYANATPVRCIDTTSRTLSIEEPREETAAVWLSEQGTGELLLLPKGARQVVLGAPRTSLQWNLITLGFKRGTELRFSLHARNKNVIWTWPAPIEKSLQRYVFDAPPDTYDLDISSPAARTLSVPNIQVRLDEIADLGRLLLKQVALIKGRVTSSGKERLPVVGARLAVAKSIAESDKQGRFSLRLNSDGPWIMHVSHSEYADAEKTINDDAAPIDVELSRGGTLIVDVLLPDGTSSVTAQLYKKESHPTPFRELRGEGNEPRLTFRHVPPGDDFLVLRGAAATEAYAEEIHIDELIEQSIFVTPQPIRLTLAVNRGGQRVSHARARLSNRWLAAELATGEDGRAKAPLWQTGRYVLQVTAPDFSAPFLTMRELTEVGDIDWAVDLPRAVVFGRVLDSLSNEPVADAGILIQSEFGGLRSNHDTSTASDGTFQATLAPGSHELQVFADQYAVATQKLIIREDEGDIHIDIPVKKLGSVRVSVTDSVGQPVANATIIGDVTSNATSPGFVTTTDGAGNATVRSDADAKLYFIIGPSGSFATLTVPPKESDPLHVELPRSDASISLLATLDDGTPAAQVGFLIIYNGLLIPPAVSNVLAHTVGVFKTNDSGHAVLSRLPSGHYGILPYTSFPQRNALLPRTSLAPALEVDIAAGQTDVHLVFK
jgi:hypothetical protein